ncbi:hypothetical protein [Thermoflexibacter ruber]|uniref:Uncharacterized protein n=1 Tax=Thermoflexibacter ruber TaxID=1003 RepID=A0A1I2FEJ8_9BACT|nr:hypothetical protein [Thermoflexibacter ruber]SFF03319.1 hypothetical protein SAMN04488541_101374 [Thermoflexibacter ruber]
MELFSSAWALNTIKNYGGKIASPLLKPTLNFAKDKLTERRGIEHIFAMVFKKAVEEFAKEKAKSDSTKEFTYTGFIGFLELIFKQSDYEKEFFYQLFLSDNEFSDEKLQQLIKNFKPTQTHYAEEDLLHFHQFLREKLKKEPVFAALIWQKDTYLYAVQTAENVEHLLMLSQEQMSMMEDLQKQNPSGQVIGEQLKTLSEKLDSLLKEASQTTETNVQRAEKIYNIGNANNSEFNIHGHTTITIEKQEVHYHHYIGNEDKPNTDKNKLQTLDNQPKIDDMNLEEFKEHLKIIVDTGDYDKFFKEIESSSYVYDKGIFNRLRQEFNFGKYDFDFPKRLKSFADTQKK